jgi:hypothetical protein
MKTTIINSSLHWKLLTFFSGSLSNIENFNRGFFSPLTFTTGRGFN